MTRTRTKDEDTVRRHRSRTRRAWSRWRSRSSPRRSRRPSRGAPPPVAGASLDDHDGLTILSTDLAEIREQLPSWASD